MKKKDSTTLTLSKIYAWVALAFSVLLVFTEDSSWTLSIAKILAILGFLYSKNNWRMFVLIASAFAFFYALPNISEGWYFLDITGNAFIFWYALKERK